MQLYQDQEYNFNNQMIKGNQLKREELDVIVLPKYLIVWILTNISTSIAGFEHKRNQDGTFYSKDQQLSETRYQVMLVASYFYKKGDKIESVIGKIECFR